VKRITEFPPDDGWQHIDYRPLLTIFNVPHEDRIMPQEYTLAGESKALYNGATDTAGGIWVRIRDENDRRLAQAAVDKQLKNTEAAKGTLSALDPNSAHLLDYVVEALGRIKDGLNGARPSGAQLDGTPMGAAMATPPDPSGTDGKPKTRGKRGGKPSTVGDVLKTVTGGPLSPAVASGGINWAESVPTPRPAPGDVIQPASGGSATVKVPIGYDGAANAFRVTDSTGWQGNVYWHAPSNAWRIMAQALDYRDDVLDVAANALDVADTTPGASLGETGAATLSAANAAMAPAAPAAPETPPAPPANPSTQRARNARHAGLGKADGQLPTTVKKAVAKKAPAAKKRK
jgi:hypothetical protein